MPKRKSSAVSSTKGSKQPSYLQPIVELRGLDLGSRQAMQLSVDNEKLYEIQPTNFFTGKQSDLLIDIKSNPIEWIDLRSVRLKTSFKILHADFTELRDLEKATVVSDFGKAFIKDVEISLGDGTIITTKNGLYAYRALWEGFYSTNSTEYHQRDYLDCNFEDDYKNMDDMGGTIEHDDFTNAGFGERCKLTADSKMVYMQTKIYTELTNQSKYFPPGIDVKFRFSFNSDPFCLLSNNPVVAERTQIYVIDSITLLVRKVTLNTGLHLNLLTKMKREAALFPVVAPRMMQITKPRGVSNITEVLLSESKLPEKVIMFQIATDRFTGSYVKVPWMFKINNYNEVYLSSSNLIFPLGKVLKPKPDDNNALREYVDFLHCTGSESDPLNSNEIIYNEYVGGRCPLCIDLTRASIPGKSGIMEAPRTGDLTLHMNLVRPLGVQTTFIFYMLYHGNLYVKDRSNVFADWLMN